MYVRTWFKTILKEESVCHTPCCIFSSTLVFRVVGLFTYKRLYEKFSNQGYESLEELGNL